ncbi:MAG TPA: epoxide hydrolase [Chryseolinea sp.]|nr:epoxide hydrolase [Chryseolinea sp.]
MKKAFKINVDQSILDDLQRRIAGTRWINDIDNAEWEYGANEAYLKALCDYWQHSFDWRKQEVELNKLPHFKTEIDEVNVHFIHIKGKGPSPTPLLLLHGWPDSFYRFYKIIPMLTDPARFGYDQNLSFDLVIPSLPGIGFTGGAIVPQEQPMRRTATVFWKLMTQVLGYERFISVGGDGGSPLSQTLAIDHPQSLIGIYLTDLGWHVASVDPTKVSKKEKHYLEQSKKVSYKDGAYAMVQITKPQTLAYSLSDSPVGLAAWLVDRFYGWCDCDGDLDASFTKDELLTNIMIYWITGTIGSSMRNYRAEMLSPTLTPEDHVNIPVGLGLFPKDIGGIPPREFAERTLNVQHWTEMPKGGHFAALEQPELLAEDIRKFVTSLFDQESSTTKEWTNERVI